MIAQRFLVYQRRGYYRPGRTTDRDTYDGRAAITSSDSASRAADFGDSRAGS